MAPLYAVQPVTRTGWLLTAAVAALYFLHQDIWFWEQARPLVFGFLPILGFWMFPLGLAFAALDFPPARRWLEGRMVRLQRVAAGG